MGTTSRPFYLFADTQKAKTEFVYALACVVAIPIRPPVAFYEYLYINCHPEAALPLPAPQTKDIQTPGPEISLPEPDPSRLTTAAKIEPKATTAATNAEIKQQPEVVEKAKKPSPPHTNEPVVVEQVESFSAESDPQSQSKPALPKKKEEPVRMFTAAKMDPLPAIEKKKQSVAAESRIPHAPAEEKKRDPVADEVWEVDLPADDPGIVRLADSAMNVCTKEKKPTVLPRLAEKQAERRGKPEEKKQAVTVELHHRAENASSKGKYATENKKDEFEEIW